MAMVYEEIFAFFSLEKGALHTSLQLALRPGQTINRYLVADRSKLTNPIRYLAMSTALVTLLYVLLLPASQFSTDVEEGMRMMGEEVEALRASDEIKTKLAQTNQFLDEIAAETKNNLLRSNSQEAKAQLNETIPERLGKISLTWMNVFLLAGLPLTSMLTWLLFRVTERNLAEHLVINSYILGFQNMLAIPFFAIGVLINMSMTASAVYMVVSFLFQFLAWRQVYQLRNYLLIFLGVIAVVLSAGLFVSLQGIVSFVLLWFATHS